jgi:hypothetical protein
LELVPSGFLHFHSVTASIQTHCYMNEYSQSRSQSYIKTDSQSVSLGVEPNLGLLTRDLFVVVVVVVVVESFCLVIWGHPL